MTQSTGWLFRRTQRWEAHIWADKKQVYLGGFSNEAHAGIAHDLMAIKCRGLYSMPTKPYSKPILILISQRPRRLALSKVIITRGWSTAPIVRK